MADYLCIGILIIISSFIILFFCLNLIAFVVGLLKKKMRDNSQELTRFTE